MLPYYSYIEMLELERVLQLQPCCLASYVAINYIASKLAIMWCAYKVMLIRTVVLSEHLYYSLQVHYVAKGRTISMQLYCIAVYIISDIHYCIKCPTEFTIASQLANQFLQYTNEKRCNHMIDYLHTMYKVTLPHIYNATRMHVAVSILSTTMHYTSVIIDNPIVYSYALM